MHQNAQLAMGVSAIYEFVENVEEAWATSNSYKVQTGHRHRKREKRMLIGISIRSVTSKRSLMRTG